MTKNVNVNDRQLIALMLTASLASTIGGLPFNALPVLLGSLSDSFYLGASTIGSMASVCFAGYLLGTLGAPFWMNRLNWRFLTLISAIGTASAFACSAVVADLRLLYLMWALIGFFASTMTCLGMRILSDLPNKVRAFGVRQGIELSLTAALLFALPPLVIAHFKYPGAALALAATVALLGLSAFWLPQRPVLVPVLPASSARGLPLPALLALAVFFLFLIGNIGLWAFLERMGAALKLAPAEIGLVFAVLKLLGGAAAFSVASFGDRLVPRAAYTLVLLGVGTGLALLASASSFITFALGAWIWEFAFTCGCVFQSAGIARSDPSGRAVVLIPAMFALASMAGPGLAGAFLDGTHFGVLLAFALVSSLMPFLLSSGWRKARAIPGTA